jgi:hypothetical protein
MDIAAPGFPAMPNPNAPPDFNGGINVPPPQPTTTTSISRGGSAMRFVAIAFGILVLAGLVMGGIIFIVIKGQQQNSYRTSTRSRPRPRRRYDDDY